MTQVNTAYGSDGYSITGGTATATPIRLKGGRYGLSCTATFGGGNVDLQVLCADGTTFVSCGTATKFSAAGYATIDLPAGVYQAVITTATAVAWSIGLIRGPVPT